MISAYFRSFLLLLLLHMAVAAVVASRLAFCLWCCNNRDDSKSGYVRSHDHSSASPDNNENLDKTYLDRRASPRLDDEKPQKFGRQFDGVIG
eukprot:CAMPEP_0172575884 /NCGR_PEP_ID=MMETSP1067-20121228/137439_1 /TAXON_ID=265564 ORGANISM="Thalassiosira punctigera, Strain Tpunct2005C2" /NCGR_SAMPLE_ID=MMETSP1067 /ASSEMBLY_ACC=CAM_ASM_000444 /LENGTH=91 /DNA_ID=CAMNT_0013368539 /DNA_START=2209 /DNA_END=2481 /DNA_ORIENTATION=-